MVTMATHEAIRRTRICSGLLSDRAGCLPEPRLAEEVDLRLRMDRAAITIKPTANATTSSGSGIKFIDSPSQSA
jgi:hypothetical protein